MKILSSRMIFLLLLTGSAYLTAAEDEATIVVVVVEQVIDCRSGNCARTEASRWSDLPKNSRNVSVSIRMGSEPVATSEELIKFLSKGFEHYKVKKVKFFVEQNDARATGIAIHSRGGTDGIYTLAEVEELKEAVRRSARLAKIDLFQ